MEEFCRFFDIHKGLTALIGGGGKTSTMYALADYLKEHGSVIVCTSTHILRPPQYLYFDRITSPVPTGTIVSTGTLDGAKLSAPSQSFAELLCLSDYILVEADGSRQLPIKAHAAHEPVIPKESNKVLAVVGIDGLDKPIKQVVHRPVLFASICGASVEDPVSTEMIRRVFAEYPPFDGIVINKADNDLFVRKAITLASVLNAPTAITAWQTNDPIKAYWRSER